MLFRSPVKFSALIERVLWKVALNPAWKRLPSTRWIVSRGRSCSAPIMMHGQITIVYHFRIICHSFVYKCSSYFIPYFFFFFYLTANWIWLAKRWFTTPADWSENGSAVPTNHPWKWVCNAYPSTFLALTVLRRLPKSHFIYVFFSFCYRWLGPGVCVLAEPYERVRWSENDDCLVTHIRQNTGI